MDTVGRKKIIYGRFSDEDRQHEDSLEAQERKVREKLNGMGIIMSDAIVLTDAGISGRLDSRPQFDVLTDMIKRNQVSLVAVDDLSRLSRGSKTLGFVQRMVFHDTRFISTGEGIDTDREGWEDLVEMYCFHHRRSSKETGRRSRRSMELRVLSQDGADGSMALGYDSTFECEDWAEQLRQGKRPRKIMIIDKVAKETVLWIFQRYAIDRWSVSDIAKDLTRRAVPKGRKGHVHYWTHAGVMKILSNEKYIGIWTWGTLETVTDDEQNIRLRKATKNKPVTSIRPGLRIVPQELWDKALARRMESAENHRHTNGKVHVKHENPKYNLGGLICCDECGSRLCKLSHDCYTYLGCPRARNHACAVHRQVGLARAEQAIYTFLSGVVTNLPDWFQTVKMAAVHEVLELAGSGPAQLRADQELLASLTGQIKNMVNEIKKGLASDAITAEISTLELQAKAVTNRIAVHKDRVRHAPVIPSDEEIRNNLARLPELLREPSPSTAHLLKKLFSKVTLAEIKCVDWRFPRIHLKVRLNPKVLVRFGCGMNLEPAGVNVPEAKETLICVEPTKIWEKWGPQLLEMHGKGDNVNKMSRVTGMAPETCTRALEILLTQRQAA